MSYGTNAPAGLQPVKTIANATWNGAVYPYLLASGYAQNVFKGDAVSLGTTADNALYQGYVISIYSRGAGTYQLLPTLGSADGFSFAVPPSVNPVDNANPGRPYWAANTVTIGGVPAVASLINDPAVIYEIQTVGGANGAVQSMCGQFSSFGFTVASGLVQGNLYTGQSSMFLDMTGYAPANTPATRNFFINELSNNPKNYPGVLYNNVQGLIANHYFRTMPVNLSA